MRKKIGSFLFVVIAVIIAAVYLTVSIIIFGRSSGTLISDTTEMYLGENAKAMATIFNTKLEDQLVMLESQTRYFADIDLSNYNSMKDTIMSTKGIGDFKNIGVANTTGATINYNGRSSGNIMLTDYFKEAMTGQSSISQRTYTDEDQDEVLVLAVPIMKGGEASGIVFGTFTKDILNRLLQTVTFAESSANVLFDDDGAILAFTPGTGYVDENDVGIRDVIGTTPDLSSDITVTYKDGNTEMIASFVSIGVHGWNFVTLLPRSVISDVSDAIGRYVIYIVIAVSLSFILLLVSIINLIKRISKIDKERARIGAELGVATKIQADMLPTDFPERDDIKLYATMTPAKEVGGDFYDFFYVDNDHIALVMADVAGKGVPAALFMTIAKIVIRNAVHSGGSPSDILYKVNNILCQNNRAGLFVTVWLGILDLNNGVIQYVNAGHEYPAVGRAGGTFDVVKDENCPPLAAMENMEFIDETLVLNPGDKLFLYTDGVPEAKNGEGARYGLDSMLKALDAGISSSAAELLHSVSMDIASFVGKLDPFDDITMMCVNYFGRNSQ